MCNHSHQNQQQKPHLKQTLQQIYENIEIPDSSTSWLRVQARLKKRHRRHRWMNNLKVSGLVIICFFLLNTAFITVPTSHSQIAGLLKNISSNIIEIFHEQPSHNNEKHPPPQMHETESPENIGSVQVVSLDEALSNAAFTLKVPTYIPDDFQLDNVRVFGESEKSYNYVQIKYENDKGDVLNILQRQIEGENSAIVATMAVEAGKYKNVIVNGDTAILIISDKGNSNLEWLTEERVLVRISSKLAESEILKIASSLK